MAVGDGERRAKAIGAWVTLPLVVPESSCAGLGAWTHDGAQFEANIEKVFEGRGAEYLETACDIARKAGVVCDCALVRGESPHAEIVLEARNRGCDLIVMASHGRSGNDAVLLASETIKVMTLGGIPVLVHPSAPLPATRTPVAAL